jgi:2-polyprenyl-3-methyl-5-hydroxy-6-metoxy-1,4-benzoquinol methylase
MFEHYLYVSGTTSTFRKHCDDFAFDAVDRFMKWQSLKPAVTEPRVLDIACNDGTLLKSFRNQGCKVQGVDPAQNLRSLTEEANIPVEVGYWGDGVVVDNFLKKFNIITATNVFAHVDDIGGFLDDCLKVLAPKDGFIVIEFPYCDNMIHHCEFDTIYHEHLSYFLVHSMMQAVGRRGLVIKDVVRTPIHGGSIRFFLKPGKEHSPAAFAMMSREAKQRFMMRSTYESFRDKVEKNKADMQSLVNGLQEDGKKVIGYGASAKGNTMLNYFELDLEYIVDDNEMKWDYLTPGRDIPIKSTQAIAEEEELYIVILAWNFYDEIVEKIENIAGNKHHYIRYVPEVTCT